MIIIYTTLLLISGMLLIALYIWHIVKFVLAVGHYKNYSFAIFVLFGLSTWLISIVASVLLGRLQDVGIPRFLLVIALIKLPYYGFKEFVSALSFYRGRDLFDQNGLNITTIITVFAAAICSLCQVMA